MISPAVVIAALVVCAILSRVAVRVAPRLGLLDVPNERSSHERVTPRGGGLAIVTAALAGMGALAVVSPEDRMDWLLLMAAGAAVAAVGLLDDLRSTRPGVKFVAQFAAAGILLGGGVVIRVVGVPLVGPVPLGVLAIPLTVFWLVGYGNLFNFMDGIDGIAAGHAAAAGACMGGWGLMRGDPVTGWGCLLVAAVSVGFLRENRPPARIFMGDVGSLFLGLLLAAFAARSAAGAEGVPFPVSFLVLGPFIYDAAFTLGRRIRAGENVLRAHRSHLYQRLVIAGRSHGTVTATYVGLTLLCGGLGTLYLLSGPTVGLMALIAGLCTMVVFTIYVMRVEAAEVTAP
jgi:UDP-N-acetylmuramyl pentapeptide phosphotransferase/UDP-N-acetylglucosamine-1-phosphate transferase